MGAASSNGTASSKKQGRKASKAAVGGKDHASAGGNGDSVRSCSAPNRRGGGGHHAKAKGFDRRNHDTFGGGAKGSGGGGAGDGGDGWDFEAMLAANERLTGRTFVYDGNPHDFGDPAHAAHVSASGTATTTATTAAGAAAARAAGAPIGNDAEPEANRNEDLVAHVKQRGGGAGGAGAGGGSGGRVMPGVVTRPPPVRPDADYRGMPTIAGFQNSFSITDRWGEFLMIFDDF